MGIDLRILPYCKTKYISKEITGYYHQCLGSTQKTKFYYAFYYNIDSDVTLSQWSFSLAEAKKFIDDCKNKYEWQALIANKKPFNVNSLISFIKDKYGNELEIDYNHFATMIIDDVNFNLIRNNYDVNCLLNCIDKILSDEHY